MDYNEMIAGLADEMLEKIAADEDEYGYEDGYYEGEEGYYEDEDGYYEEDGDYITEEDLDYMSDEQLEALASAMYEEELEKTAGARWDAVKSVPGRAGRAVKNYGRNMIGADWRAGRKGIKDASAALEDMAGHPSAIRAKDALAKSKKQKAAGRKGTLKAWGGTAAAAAAAGGAGYGAHRLRAKGQEKAAALYEEAQLYKQAAEEIFEESQMIQDAATLVFDYLGEE